MPTHKVLGETLFGRSAYFKLIVRTNPHLHQTIALTKEFHRHGIPVASPFYAGDIHTFTKILMRQAPEFHIGGLAIPDGGQPFSLHEVKPQYPIPLREKILRAFLIRIRTNLLHEQGNGGIPFFNGDTSDFAFVVQKMLHLPPCFIISSFGHAERKRWYVLEMSPCTKQTNFI